MCKLTDMICEHEASKRFAAGEDPSFSHNIAEQLTAGYGKISYGEFQFPLYPAKEYLRNYRQNKGI